MKTILISGGTKGVGRATVLALLREGYRVATFSRSVEHCEHLMAELRYFPLFLDWWTMDTTLTEACASVEFK